jgi:predicted  nucleic acid-binding Zn-ribbon protein
MSSELGQQVVELARTVLEQQRQLAEKDALLRRSGAPTHDAPSVRQSVDSQATAATAATAQQAAAAKLGAAEDVKALKALLVQNMELLVTREQELDEVRDACVRYQGKMQAITDQVKLLYRDYANAVSRWKVERGGLEQRLKRVQEDADGFRAANQEMERGMEAMGSGSRERVQEEFADVVRRMAVVQIKHARVARKLEASAMSEKALQDRVRASSTARSGGASRGGRFRRGTACAAVLQPAGACECT